jgi:deazaflavin-dependent oxidoreductase (nitroreductase family)
VNSRVRTRRLNAFERALERFAASPAGGWFFVKVGHAVDPYLLKWTRGRLSVAVGQPVLLLTVTGAKSGRPRETPLLFATDGDDLVLVASNAGNLRHPAWYHNVRANPEVEILAARGRSGRYLGREAEGEERERLWGVVNDLYAGYDVYQGRANHRRIPVMVFSRVG